ncbi:MAG: hypothetical protein QXU60_05485 [Sulfolobales archaeon]
MGFRVEIYSHFTCPTSYRLFKRLLERGLLEKVKIYDVGINPYKAYARRIVSVPSIYIDDILYYSGVFSVLEAVRTIENSSIQLEENFDYAKAVERIMLGYLDSSMIALSIFVYDDLESPFIFREFIEAVSRHIFYKYKSEESFENLRKEFISYIDNNREYFFEELLKAVAKILARDIVYTYWPEKPETYYFDDINKLLSHIYSRLSLGRVGMIAGYHELLKPRNLRSRVEYLKDHIDRNWDNLVEALHNDLGNILKDEQYIREYSSRVVPIELRSDSKDY